MSTRKQGGFMPSGILSRQSSGVLAICNQLIFLPFFSHLLDIVLILTGLLCKLVLKIVCLAQALLL